MMDKIQLVRQIENYTAFDQTEEEMRLRFLEILKDDLCFQRERLQGHITASAWIVSDNLEKVLLLHHRKLKKWLQPGGHCDGDIDTLRVAIKEVHEETGLVLTDSSNEIFDLDIHTIPERKGIPMHEHFDIRYQFNVPLDVHIQNNEESLALAWVSLNEINDYTQETSILRMVAKTLMNN